MWDQIFDDSIYDSDHFFMFSQLAFPDQVHNFCRQSILLCQELQETTRTLYDLQVSVFTKNSLKDTLLKNPVLQVIRSQPFWWRHLKASIHFLVLLVYLPRFISIEFFVHFNFIDHIFDMIESLESLLKVSALQEPMRHEQLVALHQLRSLSLRVVQTQELFHIAKNSTHHFFVDLLYLLLRHVADTRKNYFLDSSDKELGESR